MAVYAVLLHARNLSLVDDEGGISSGGLYCWRFVEAWGQKRAIDRAINSLRSDPQFVSNVWNSDSESIEIDVDEIDKVRLVDSGMDPAEANTALVFYRETSESSMEIRPPSPELDMEQPPS